MFDDIATIVNELITQLSPVANELHNHVEELADKIEEEGEEYDRTEIARKISDSLNQACKTITKLESKLSSKFDGDKLFIDELKARYGHGTIGIAEGCLDEVLANEEQRLGQIGLNDAVINLVIQQMRSTDRLQDAEKIIDPNDLLAVIRDAQAHICKIAEHGNSFVQWSPVTYLRAAAGSVLNVCVVTGDVLTPFVVPDPTFKSYVIAAKSVKSGFSSLVSHCNTLRNGYRNYFHMLVRRNRNPDG